MVLIDSETRAVQDIDTIRIVSLVGFIEELFLGKWFKSDISFDIAFY